MPPSSTESSGSSSSVDVPSPCLFVILEAEPGHLTATISHMSSLMLAQFPDPIPSAKHEIQISVKLDSALLRSQAKAGCTLCLEDTENPLGVAHPWRPRGRGPPLVGASSSVCPRDGPSVTHPPALSLPMPPGLRIRRRISFASHTALALPISVICCRHHGGCRRKGIRATPRAAPRTGTHHDSEQVRHGTGRELPSPGSSVSAAMDNTASARCGPQGFRLVTLGRESPPTFFLVLALCGRPQGLGHP